ncbi:4968_t:CDS:2 [Entrophospora sp. SA101]|nr:15796_t:CDS:2 [Entrophospora sp. SA101]CAJ0749569.1 4968_t:CDS:2 [Entrophospora sp. SA101]CAJ0835532.1 87_t:CDS:2 [Entrophospora sp. SA101]
MAKNIFASTLAGTGAGIVEVLIVQPTDVLKTRVSLQYAGFAMFRPIFVDMETKRLTPLGSSSALTGVCTGVLQSITLVTPLELIKIRQQTDISKKKYKGMISTIGIIVKEEGIFALYKGLLPTIFKQSWGLGIKFSAYTAFKDLFLSYNNNNSASYQHAASGFLANVIVGILNSPPDVVKTRMQDQSSLYKTSWNCCKLMLKEEGFLAFFRGASLRVLRVAPGGGIQFMTYEYLLKSINEKF